MKKLLLLLLLTLLVRQTYSQSRFPFGAFVATSTPIIRTGYYDTIALCGFNTIIQRLDATTKAEIENHNFDVIALNTNRLSDYVYKYASSHFKIWEVEGDEYNSKTNIRLHTGENNIVKYLGEDCVASNYIYNDSLIYGPNYSQEVEYDKEVFIPYHSKFYIAGIKGLLKSNDDTACVLLIKNIRQTTQKINGNDTSFVDTLILGSYVVKNNELINSSFFPYTFDFGYYPYYSRYAKRTKDLDKSINSTTDTLPSYTNLGTEYIVLDKANAQLYVDKVIIYDNNGNYLYFDPAYAKNEINNYTSDPFYQVSYLKNWYGHDEPQSLDDYYPLNFVSATLRDLNKPSLIQAFYPQWDGSAHGSPSIERYIQEVQPSRFMFDFYPAWLNEDWSFDINLLKIRLVEANTFSKDFYYTAQSFGGDNKRKPSSNEICAMTYLGLSFGAKGIFYWNYLSYGGYDCIVDTNSQPTYLYYAIKDKIAPRINNLLGKTLLKLNYTDYLYFYKRDGIVKDQKMTTTNVSFIDDYFYDNIQFAGGILEDKNDIENKYVFPVNLDVNDIRTLRIFFTGFNKYNNYRLKNVDKNDIDVTFKNNYILQYNFQPADALLFQASPVIRYGGKLTLPESINEVDTLKDRMTITTGDTLIINKKYYANASISLESGANIRLNTYGYLIMDDTANVFINSFLQPIVGAITRANHPRIIWGKYNSSFYVFYRIYRKYGTADWIVRDTTSNLQYIDDLTIDTPDALKNGTQILYKVEAVEKEMLEDDPAPIFHSHNSPNIVNYRINTAILDKQTNTNEDYSFVLNQNYPNPFNPETIISYELPEDGLISIKVYDILGKEVCTLINENQTRGSHQILFNYKTYSLSSGVYFYKLQTDNYSSVKKMMIIK